MTEDCSESCKCTSTGTVCQTKSCAENYVCTVYNLKRDCHRGGTFSIPLEHICMHTLSRENRSVISVKNTLILTLTLTFWGFFFLPAESPCLRYPCLNGGTCEESGNSYICRCADGFTGSNCEVEKDDGGAGGGGGGGLGKTDKSTCIFFLILFVFFPEMTFSILFCLTETKWIILIVVLVVVAVVAIVITVVCVCKRRAK